MAKSVEELKQIAAQLRIDVISMLVEAGSGHSGGSLSSADIMSVLFFNEMNYDPKNTQWEERDRFVLSKGHVCPIFYAALARAGYYPVEEMLTLRKLHSRLQGHPGKNKGLPGIEVSTGSLGQGLSVGVGLALGAKTDKKNWRVYVLNGDGELDEGSIWEAIMAAGHYHLDNLVSVVDNNDLQIDGRICDVMDIYPIDKKFEAFNWYAIHANGHDVGDLLKALAQARENKSKPTAIIAHTTKGKGVSFMENQAGWHGKAPNVKEAKQALEELRREQERVGIWRGAKVQLQPSKLRQ
jgi:transketolase